MNGGEIVIAAVGAAGGIGGAVFAWVQARAAVDSLADAREAQEKAAVAQQRAETARDEALALSRKANAAFERQAEAQEEANRLRVEEQKPKTWAGPNWDGEKTRSWRNNSGEEVTVHRATVVPNEESGMVRIRAPHSIPGSVPANGSLRYLLIKASGRQAELLEVEYEIAGNGQRLIVNLPLS
ncbi:hypothetical protein EDF62_3093 [Leucobacter luti]|uniref:Uncharacterized protein n=1 Tax=Leucobacter luti TaxID=340320 RepID=A0A4R6RUQ3_9MICO|nr:hypothetical protein [Leucobacter luti]TDP89796.1 hypothetical protein EDF62_3093 [Leucobacter luti]